MFTYLLSIRKLSLQEKSAKKRFIGNGKGGEITYSYGHGVPSQAQGESVSAKRLDEVSN